MKSKIVEKLLLLEQTGELSKRQRRRLNARPEAKAMREALNALCEAVPVVNEECSPWTVAKIDARLRKERRSILLPARIWKPILALAACLTVVVGTWDFKSAPSVDPVDALLTETETWAEEFNGDLVELENQILVMSDSSLDIREM